MSANHVRFIDAILHRHATHTRMPFRFGIAVMTSAQHVLLSCRYEIDGQVHTGIAADGLLPRWFDKSPDVTPEQELTDLLTVIRKAVALAGSVRAGTVFAQWRELYVRQLEWAKERGLPPLLAHFGVSMVERTMIDALARARCTTLSTLLRDNLLGIDLGALHPELAGHTPRDHLPSAPLTSVIARHTVGLSDPLTASDVAAEQVLNDGLPQTLEACIAAYGLRQFKLKLCGDRQVDVARLRRIASLVTAICGDDIAFTVDGNEQYRSVTAFRSLWEELQGDPALRHFLRGLIFVEQPLYRGVALDPAVADLRSWPDAPPMIIDESDAETGDLPRALDLGYVGTSHKNCKGVIKGVVNRCLLSARERSTGRRHFMSGEDLVNIGPVALLQDLAAQAALGNASVERNGHHYFRGLTMFPPEIAATILATHDDLYTPFAGSARLDIRDGRLRLDSVNAAPFGVAAIPPLAGLARESLSLASGS